MRRSFTLSKKHYAGGWQVLDVDDRSTVAEVNKLAFEFATTEDSARREALQMQLLENFHSYILKYLNMIIYGQLPLLSSPAGKDARIFLKLLLAKRPDTLDNLRNTCKSLHLAFKDHSDTDEVYDTLAFIFMKVCAHYDPLYPKKMEKVCNYIEKQAANEVTRVDDINTAVGFDPTHCIRILVKGGYIESVLGEKKVISGYKRGENWPVPKKYFQVTSMGFVGFAQRFFRWYLRNYIGDKMGELENTKDVMQLDYISLSDSSEDTGAAPTSGATPSLDGELVDTRGIRWAADMSLMEHWRTLDLSEMNDKWVESTEDFLFKKLSKEERYILQLVFVKEYSWSEVGKILQCDSETAHKRFKQIMIYLQGRSTIKSKPLKIE